MNGFPTEMIQSLEGFQEELAGARSFVNVAARNASSLLIPRPPAAPGTRLGRTTREKWGLIQKPPGGAGLHPHRAGKGSSME